MNDTPKDRITLDGIEYVRAYLTEPEPITFEPDDVVRVTGPRVCGVGGSESTLQNGVDLFLRTDTPNMDGDVTAYPLDRRHAWDFIRASSLTVVGKHHNGLRVWSEIEDVPDGLVVDMVSRGGVVGQVVRLDDSVRMRGEVDRVWFEATGAGARLPGRTFRQRPNGGL